MKLSVIIPISFLLSSVVFCQEQKLDSLAKATTSIKDSLNIKIASDLIYELSNQEKYDLGLNYCDAYIEIAKKIKHTKGTGQIIVEKANICIITDKPKKALELYDDAERCFQSSNYKKGIAVINNNKAIIEQRLGNTEKSIKLLLNASQYYKKLNDSTKLADTFNNIGNAYKGLHDINKAKEYYKKSIKIKRKYKSKNLASTMNNLALTHIDAKESDSAINILNEALEESKRQNDSRSLAGVYNALGRIYLDQKEYGKSKENFEASMFIGGKAEFKGRLVTIKHSLALIALETGNLEEAEIYLKDARSKLEKLNYANDLMTNYKFSAKLDSSRGNHIGASNWKKKLDQLQKKNN